MDLKLNTILFKMVDLDHADLKQNTILFQDSGSCGFFFFQLI